MIVIGNRVCEIDKLRFEARLVPIEKSLAEVAEVAAPYYLFAIEKFGAERCMFESNFPVDKVSFSYNVMYNAFKRVSQEYSPSERAELLHDTAARVYRISV